jgi:hypothetical protein
MKKSAIFFLSLLFLTTSFIGCRENKEEDVMTQEEALIEEMKDDNADIKTKTDGDETKIKMETDTKEVKIKTEEGETKMKVKTETDDN